MSITAKIRSALSSFTKERDDLAAKIARLKEERDRVRDDPLPLEEALEVLDQTISAYAAKADGRGVGQYRVGRFVGAAAVPSTLTPLISKEVDPSIWLCKFFPDRVREVLAADIRERLEGCEGLPRAERQKRLAKLEAEIAKLEREEVELVREAGDLGVNLPYRADTDPAALLGWTESDEGK